MKTIDDIDFNALYAAHQKAARYTEIPASHWDAKAERMSRKANLCNPGYVPVVLEQIGIAPEETVLDIGCGPGTLSLPLASACRHVWALDYSPKMLEVLEGLASERHLENITTIRRSWSDDWSDVPEVDVAVSSRATLVGDLDGMLERLNAKARDRVVITAITDPHFFDEAIFKAIGRDDKGYPTYIYAVNRLHQMGIECEVRFITNPPKPFKGTFEELAESLAFSIGGLTDEEKTRLKAFYDERAAKGIPIRHGQSRWAMLSWSTRR